MEFFSQFVNLIYFFARKLISFVAAPIYINIQQSHQSLWNEIIKIILGLERERNFILEHLS